MRFFRLGPWDVCSRARRRRSLVACFAGSPAADDCGAVLACSEARSFTDRGTFELLGGASVARGAASIRCNRAMSAFRSVGPRTEGKTEDATDEPLVDSASVGAKVGWLK